MDGLDESDLDKVRQIIKDSGELIFAQRSGSWSFNLSLPTSDKDYFGVFVAPDPLHIPAQSFDHTVPGSGDDWVVYELGKYVELVLKGNPKVVEPLFATHFTYTTPTWDRVAAFLRPLVINRTTVAQYTSFASFEMKDALGKKVKAEAAIRKAFADKHKSSSDAKSASKPSTTEADPEELSKELATITLASHGKPFYHGLRLAREALRLQKGLPPNVWMEGEDRDELMAIRTGKCTKTFEQVAEQVKHEIDIARSYTPQASSGDSKESESVASGSSALQQPSSSIPEAIDAKLVGQWLVDFRMPMLIEIANKESRKSKLEAETSASSSPLVSPQVIPEFETVLSRAKILLESNGFSDAIIIFVAPIGSELLKRLEKSTSTMDASADFLVVYRLPVAKILNTTVEVPKIIFERPTAKSGQGIWAVEIAEARDAFSRHHALFESAVLLAHDSSRFEKPIVWSDAAWEPFGAIVANALSKSEIPSFGLLSHYLGVVTGLLRSPETWKGSKDVSGAVKKDGVEEKPADVSSQQSESCALDAQVKALYLAKRLLAQADLLLSRQSTDSPALLSAEECTQLLRMRSSGGCGSDSKPASEDADTTSTSASSIAPSTEAEAELLRATLLDTITSLQARLKAQKLPSTFSKETKKALEQEIRQARFDTV